MPKESCWAMTKNMRGFRSARTSSLPSTVGSSPCWTASSPWTKPWCVIPLWDKKQSKQWTTKCKPVPLKAQVHAGQTKQMVIAFFYYCLIYTHIVPRGASVNAIHTNKPLGRFLEHFNKKRSHHGPVAVMVSLGHTPVNRAIQCGRLNGGERSPGAGVLAPFCQTWHRPVFSCLGEWKRPWWASPWTKSISRMPVKGLPGPSPLTTLPWLSGGSLSGKSMCG